MNTEIKQDMLSLLNTEKLFSSRPYSNISEYCLRDGDAVKRFISSQVSTADIDTVSDYELLVLTLEAMRKNKKAFVSKRIRQTLDCLCETDTEDMTAEEIWLKSSNVLDRKKAENLFSFDLDLIGIPASPNCNDRLPNFIGKTKVISVACPFGTAYFDISKSAEIKYNVYDTVASAHDCTAIFIKDFAFEEPNEYVAQKSYEKLCERKKLLDKEQAILSSQLVRKIILNCAKEGKELMLFVPAAPYLHSMCDLAKLLDYADSIIKEGNLRASIFASDAVGLCFASSVSAKQYKKITAAPGICGNGCGCAGEEDASYWGADSLALKRASLSSTPAFIGK